MPKVEEESLCREQTRNTGINGLNNGQANHDDLQKQ